MVALGVVAKSLMTIHPYVLHGACGWRNMVALGVVAKSLITILDLGQPRVILDEGLKTSMNTHIGVTIVHASMATPLVMDEVSWT